MEPQTSDKTTLTKPATTDKQPAIPAAWPGAFGIFQTSKNAVMLNISGLLLLSVLYVVIWFITNGDQNWMRVISNLASVYLSIVGMSLILAGTKGEKLPIADAFGKGAKPALYLKMVGLWLITGAATIVSLVLLVVPFFFVLPRLILAPYYLIDKDMLITDALSASWANSKGHAGKVWGIIGAIILMTLLFVTIIGIPVAVYLLFMYSAAFAVLYRFVSNQPKTAKTTAPTAPTTPPSA